MTTTEMDRPGPTMETSAMANSRKGNERTTSISRDSTVSTPPVE